MKVQCLEFREGTVNVNVVVIVNLRSVATILLIYRVLRGIGDTSADSIVNTVLKTYSAYRHAIRD